MKQQKMVRELALDLLVAVEKQRAYSNLLLNQIIDKNQLNQLDAALLTEITYGTIQRKLTLEYFLHPFIHKQKRLEIWVKLLLLLSIYQMKYLTKVPDHAVIHEAVEIAKKRAHKGVASFVNGVLRNIQRNGFPSIEEINDPLERLAIETSHPLWLVKNWCEQFGFETTKQICFENLQTPVQSARVNRYLTNEEEAINHLAHEGIIAEKSNAIPEAITCKKGNMAKTKAYQEGLFTIQDESSMIVGYVVDPKEEERILDCCAAPGGKTTHLSEKMNNTGSIIALDLHKHKVKLIQDQAKRLRLTNIHSEAMDCRKASEHFSEESFDKVLVDAPCSGFGVLKRKPEIKYFKTARDRDKLANIQLEMLGQVASLVKKGGYLIYSTCTIDQYENQGVAKKFLQRHPEFSGDYTLIERVPEKIKPLVSGYEVQILPQHLKSDGFYIACFQKKV